MTITLEYEPGDVAMDMFVLGFKNFNFAESMAACLIEMWRWEHNGARPFAPATWITVDQHLQRLSLALKLEQKVVLVTSQAVFSGGGAALMDILSRSESIVSCDSLRKIFQNGAPAPAGGFVNELYARSIVYA